MIGLSQTSWFWDKLNNHYTLTSSARNLIENLSEEKYTELKALYYAGFATSDTKPSDKEALSQLDLELSRLGILND